MTTLELLTVSGYEVLSNVKRGWYHVSKDNEEGIVYRQNANTWHYFFNSFEGSGSGSSPENMETGCLGDVLDDTRAYSKALLAAPEAYYSISDGLYRCSSDVYNSR
tara:strand:- start:583 stop:900 length:318 start_codon:yes stop_codon:yes gene_type:complete